MPGKGKTLVFTALPSAPLNMIRGFSGDVWLVAAYTDTIALVGMRIRVRRSEDFNRCQQLKSILWKTLVSTFGARLERWAPSCALNIWASQQLRRGLTAIRQQLGVW